VYSGKIDGEPTTFGTTGFLYRSNKLMYDRLTRSVWNQFTGVPVIGPLAENGTRFSFFPVLLTTWEDWVEEHPDTTVLSQETGIYPRSLYVPESDPNAIYYDYFNSDFTMSPNWNHRDDLFIKDIVMGLGIGESYKAYPVAGIQRERVVNDTLGGENVVVIASPSSEAARAYRRDGRVFDADDDDSTAQGLPTTLLDAAGGVWEVTEDHLVSDYDPSLKLDRISTHMSFWFGWSSFHPETELYSRNSR